LRLTFIQRELGFGLEFHSFGQIRADTPAIKSIFAVLGPTTLPTAIPGEPLKHEPKSIIRGGSRLGDTSSIPNEVQHIAGWNMRSWFRDAHARQRGHLIETPDNWKSFILAQILSGDFRRNGAGPRSPAIHEAEIRPQL